jgi:flagellar protein FlbD
MIQLTRINGQNFFLNSELIEQLESTPDTVITLVNGKTVMVAEPVKVVIRRILKFRRRITGLSHVTKQNSKSA